jgi:hypothetical protein
MKEGMEHTFKKRISRSQMALMQVASMPPNSLPMAPCVVARTSGADAAHSIETSDD